MAHGRFFAQPIVGNMLGNGEEMEASSHGKHIPVGPQVSGRSRSCGRPRHSNIQSLNEFSIENGTLRQIATSQGAGDETGRAECIRDIGYACRRSQLVVLSLARSPEMGAVRPRKQTVCKHLRVTRLLTTQRASLTPRNESGARAVGVCPVSGLRSSARPSTARGFSRGTPDIYYNRSPDRPSRRTLALRHAQSTSPATCTHMHMPSTSPSAVGPRAASSRAAAAAIKRIDISEFLLRIRRRAPAMCPHQHERPSLVARQERLQLPRLSRRPLTSLRHLPASPACVTSGCAPGPRRPCPS